MRTLRWVFVAWIVALPLMMSGMYAVGGEDAPLGAVILVELLVVPWLVGLVVLALLARRWRTAG